MNSKWDIRFLELAKFFSNWAKDPSTKCGAVIVRGKNEIMGHGYNGFPVGMPDHDEFYNNREEKYSRIIHCEMNALMFSKGPVDGCTLYTYPFLSCDRCFVHMVQKGITRFVSPLPTYDQLTRWGPSLKRVRAYAKEMNIEISEIGFN